MNKLARALFVLWLAAIVFAIAYPTLNLPYISDDFEHGQLVAQIRAGLQPGSHLITVPFHGQTLVLLRLIFWLGTMAGHMSLAWVRFAICLVHIAAAIGCAMLCARWTGSRRAAFFAGTLYAGALGFINEQVWWPSSAIFCLGAAFFILAMTAIEYGALGWAIALLIVAALGMNGVLIPALILPVYCWILGRRRDAKILLGVIAALLALAFWQQTRTHDREPIEFSLRALELGAWLIGTAPFRFFAGFTTLAVPGFRTILHWSAVAWLPFAASAWMLRKHHGRALLLAWLPAVIISLMVGFTRANYHDRYGPGVLYVADRYYYFFLLPLVVQLILLATAVRLPRWIAPAVLAAALIGSAVHFRANITLGHFDSSARAIAQGRAIVQTIQSSSVRPLVLSDAPIYIDGALKNTMSLAFLIYAEYPRGISGVQMIRGRLDPQQAAVQDSLLRPWLKPLSSRVDFKARSYEEALISGFSWWEAPFRWMGPRGELRLIAAPGPLVISAYAPVDQLRRPIELTVSVNGVAIGQLAISNPGLIEYSLPVSGITLGTTADIVLTSDFVWHARDIFPDSLDERDLSIAISSIGFAMRP
ncbi:MAG TPA: hypothetical protein VFW44_13445 [Bryobacteraceae bacterium]|nr:hypothetical protein [Bryobacteraceae bacterium]